MSTRRNVLRLIGMAPVAAPVAAKEAAASMGLKGVIGAPTYGAGREGPVGPAAEDMLKNALKQLTSKSYIRDMEKDASYAARILDSDIASFRSISPAAAYAIQRTRYVHRIPQERRAQLQIRLEEELAHKMGLS